MHRRLEFGPRAWVGRVWDGFISRVGVGVVTGWREGLVSDDDWGGAEAQVAMVA